MMKETNKVDKEEKNNLETSQACNNGQVWREGFRVEDVEKDVRENQPKVSKDCHPDKEKLVEKWLRD